VATANLLLVAARSDSRAQRTGDGWITRCLHCGSQVGVRDDGVPLGTTTVEHIVPRSWFGRRGAEEVVALVETAASPRNLALACARCNQQKGRTHDARGPEDARAVEVVKRLLHKRLARYRQEDAV
jgi:5-methylcytosine-specific restriction endonuclease McrA